MSSILFKLQKYYSQDNLVFDSMYSHFFNPIFASELYANSSQITVPKDFRIDLGISELTVDFSLIKVISILNEKPQGIFSYSEGDIVYVPSQNSVNYINTEYFQLVDENIELNTSLNDTLQNAYTNLQENLSKLDVTQIYKYISQVDQYYLFLINEEYQVNQLYKGIV